MKLLGNMNIKDNELYIGEISCKYLAEKYDTPLFIIDEDDFRKKANKYLNNFSSKNIETRVIYASKAMLNIYMAKVIKEENLFIDVVSGGELYTVLKANFPKDKIYFHGNNKLKKELKLAIENNIGTIVIDNKDEIRRLKELLEDTEKKQKVLLRVNPGIDAHTHEYIKTTKLDSKFGESIFDENIYSIVKEIVDCENLIFEGFHCHIGSQIFEKESFFKEAETMMEFTKKINEKLNIKVKELNLGGGFGVYYTEEDKPFKLEKFLKEFISKIEKLDKKFDLNLKRVDIEPGRSLISNSGSTLYRIGGIKETYGGKDYIFVDGGMTDNPRPALYQAKYEAIIANKANNKNTNNYTIAGKCCESGDILIENCPLPKAEENDLLLISSTGAYTYSMSSNYNRIEKPAMVFINKDKVKLAVRRQTYEDIIREDVDVE
ncbi:diaminopimelate decarboxylase [Miniphocaeibacter halophilus]|uniref:Diaminopimelate decarboxylase n=1 Tax=Miniphocaeibacter halophilus TaxID=2931922 RepID=A0AC61MPS6_9FIRM|nr:diaminopimelate decarboxylase [Miniphocaeibacter halophilus]QQK07570.1 diaminopimelate decarboxylase [Miniphocaeibacter halophilus]